MISGAAKAGHGDAAPCGRSPTTHTPPKGVHMKITMNLDPHEVELLKDGLICRREELREIATEEFKEGNKTLYRHHMVEKDMCAILYDYIVDLTKCSE